MNPHASRPHRRIAAFSVLLALSLLFTQWLGYAHAIAHAGGLPELESSSQIKAEAFDHAKASGACSALDALALGAGLQSTVLAPLPTMAADAPIVLPPRAGHHRLFTAHFSSRAPPLNA
jgi:hypothetical protein